MYTLIYSDKFLKKLERLNKDIQRRILANLEKIRIRPFPYVKKLVGSLYFRLRVGEYRIILDIKENKHDHQKEIIPPVP